MKNKVKLSGKVKLLVMSVLIVGFAFSETSGITDFTHSLFQNDDTGMVVPETNSYGNKGIDPMVRPEIFGSDPISNNVQEVRLGDLIFKAKKIETVQYLASKGLSQTEIDEELANGLDESLFYFDIQETNRLDILKKYHVADMDAAVSYLAFGIDQDFLVVTDQGDTIRPNYSMYERNFHSAPFERIILNFSGLDQIQEFKLIYNDVLFKKGKMEFKFQNDINQFLISENV